MRSIGVVGGTGALGYGLALRFVAAGETVLVGSRVAERARETAERVRAAVPDARVESGDNDAIVARADVIVLAMPYDGVVPFLDADRGRLVGKLVIDVVVPLAFAHGVAGLAPVDGGGSVGELVQRRVPGARVVSAFKNLPAGPLADLAAPAVGDVILCGEHADARADVAALVARIPKLRAVDAGALSNARHLEALTALLLNVNRRHHTQASIVLPSL